MNTAQTISGLNYSTQYAIQVYASDGIDTVNSAVRYFTTKSRPNSLPEISTVSGPSDGAANVGLPIIFNWTVNDADSDIITSTLFFGINNPPMQTVYNGTEQQCTVSVLDYSTTYYWYIQSADGKDTSTTAIKSLTTRERTWQEVANIIEPSTYIIGLLKSSSIIGVGTGFAIDDSTIMTNAHVVYGLKEYLTEWGDTTLKAIAVQNGGSLFGNGFHYLKSFAIHPDYDTSTSETYDVAIITIDGSFDSFVEFETLENIKSLQSGDEIASIGFPGELNFMTTQNPIASFKNGTVSAVRAFGGAISTPENSYYVQHNLNLSGGTSGSPIFTKNAKVVAINNSGIEVLVYSAHTESWERVPQSALGFGIRADLRTDALTASKTRFEDLEPVIVTYEFINDTWADLQMSVDGEIYDTIGYKDTISLWDYAKTPVELPISFKSIVATNNYLMWKDTMYTGVDFSRRYIVTDDYFLWGLKNSTNKSVNSCVVDHYNEYDSSYVYLTTGTYKDIGFYPVATYTNFRLYFYNATQYVYWEDINTRSTTGYAEFIYLEATSTLSKKVANSINDNPKSSIAGNKRVFKLTDYLERQK